MVSTHGVEYVDDVVVKRFRSWDRGEHLREWRGLQLLKQYAPDLAPTPLRAELKADPPTFADAAIDPAPRVC